MRSLHDYREALDSHVSGRGHVGADFRGAIYQGRPSRLSDEQMKELVDIVEAGPEVSGLDTGVWTSPIITDLVRRRFGIKYHPSQIRRILHKLGFSIQYPSQGTHPTSARPNGCGRKHGGGLPTTGSFPRSPSSEKNCSDDLNDFRAIPRH